MRQAFAHYNFKDESLAKIAQANEIIHSSSTKQTLRQLYYQFVRRNWIPNVDREYKNLSALLTKARMAGLVDWEALEDRLRQPKIPYHAENVGYALKTIHSAYRRDLQSTQAEYMEVWIEKDALSGIVEPITRKYMIRLMVNRGYSSCTAMYDAAERIKYYGNGQGTILYLGDHDPSGLDMVRDVESRLTEFGVDVTVDALALTMGQIKQYQCPPNPAKRGDARSDKYIAEKGVHSWELDALPSEALQDITEEGILKYLDKELFDEQVMLEAREKSELFNFIQKFS